MNVSSESAVPATSEVSGQSFSAAYKRYALGVMATIYLCNLLDRGLMDLLAQPIKEDLHLSDTQLGFLTGLAFALFYATLGLPIARWADRGNRVTIASLAIALWGFTVMACLLVTSYVQLLVARIAAAVGESGCKPPTYSLIGDYFPRPAERTRAMAAYWLGGPLAILVSSILGGWLSEHYGWRMTFFLMGIPGLVLAMICKSTLIEPRARFEISSLKPRALPPLGVVLRTLWHQRACRHLTFALILLFTMLFGLGAWSAAFMMRSHGMGTAELGLWFGTISGLGSAGSVLLSGYVCSRWFADNERGQMRLSALAIALSVPGYLAFLLLPHKYLALSMLIPLMLVMNFCIAPTFALMQRLVTDDMRATTMAIIMLLYNLVGMGLGPQAVGLLSDALRPSLGSDSLRYSMLLMSLVAFWSAFHFWQVGRTVREDISVVLRQDRVSLNTSVG